MPYAGEGSLSCERVGTPTEHGDSPERKVETHLILDHQPPLDLDLSGLVRALSASMILLLLGVQRASRVLVSLG
jgi:hypothetical protein